MPSRCQNQNPVARKMRLQKGRCPVHNKPMLQCDGWYQPRYGRRYTFVSCVDANCRVEAFADFTFGVYRLTPKWQYLLEQNELGSGQILDFPIEEIKVSSVKD